MTNEEIRRRAEDAHVKYIKENICDCNGNKDYVFISYKSDDWETVLHDIVFRLVHDYGLNVYFDGSFDSHNSLWIRQFPENMSDYKCKGVIAFFDDKYATSYATLMELLYSQSLEAACGNEEGLPIVSIDLAKMTDISDAAAHRDTGLGVKTYEDGTVNVNAEAEKGLFSESFDELVKREILQSVTWKPKRPLKAWACSRIVRELKAYKGISDNYYTPGMSLDDIDKTIKSACGETVFSPKTQTVKPSEKSTPVEKDVKIVAKVEESTSEERTPEERAPVEGYVYTIFGKEYHAGSREQGKLMFDAFEALTGRYPEYAERLTQRTSVARAADVKNPNTKAADPSYFRGCKSFYINGSKYLVGTSYGYNAKIAEIKGMFKICGVPFSEFVLKSEPIGSASAPVAVRSGHLKKTDDSNAEEIVADHSQTIDTDGFQYSLWGMSHTAKKMSDLMHDVFDLIAEKYPEKISELAASDAVSSVALKEDVDQQKLPSGKLSYFRAAREHLVGGRAYYVGTSYNRAQGIGQLERMLTICEGRTDGFRITSSPERISHSGGKTGKKGISELLL